jgi:hypothetical protein
MGRINQLIITSSFFLPTFRTSSSQFLIIFSPTTGQFLSGPAD